MSSKESLKTLSPEQAVDGRKNITLFVAGASCGLHQEYPLPRIDLGI